MSTIRLISFVILNLLLLFYLENNMDKVIKGDLYINGKKVNENINIEAHGKTTMNLIFPLHLQELIE